MSQSFLAGVKSRRTYYSLGNESPISDQHICDIVQHTILHTPSAFNSQSTRCVLLLHEEHDKLWRDIVKPILKPVVPAEQWPSTINKLDGLQAAYGTVLLYEDPQTVATLQEQYPLYSAKFPEWAEHTNAMHTFVAWTAFHQEGLGCNLQHYNPLIDQRVAEEWSVPRDWQLKGQLVFGVPTGPPKTKTFQPLETRLSVHGMPPVNGEKTTRGC